MNKQKEVGVCLLKFTLKKEKRFKHEISSVSFFSIYQSLAKKKKKKKKKNNTL